jgi:hypothetical protein
MNLEDWILLAVSLLILFAGVSILLGLLSFLFKVFYRYWWIFVIAIIGLLLVAQLDRATAF